MTVISCYFDIGGVEVVVCVGMRFYVISLFLMVCNFWIIVIILELKFPSSIFL